MNRNYIRGDVNDALPMLLSDLLSAGDEVGSRAGRTLELTHIGITLERPTDRYLMLPGRKHNIAAQIAETMWVLSGRDDMAFLSEYLPRAKDFSDDGETWRAGYGKRIRSWPGRNFSNTHDQLAYVVDKLKADPLTRQAVISIWDPAVDTAPGKDIPCNDWITFSNRLGKLDMHVGLRSNDAIWGWSGINAFEWSSMLEIVAGLVGVAPGSLHFSTTSFHLYEHHWKKARTILDQVSIGHLPVVKKAPAFKMDTGFFPELSDFDELARQWFSLEESIRVGQKAADDAVEAFPEPMLQSWLRVLQWWWSGDDKYLEPLKDTSLAESCRHSVQPKRETVVDGDEIAKTGSSSAQSAWDFLSEVFKPVKLEQSPYIEGVMAFAPGKVWETPNRSPFIVAATRLHLEKHEAYGDSWMKRGEMVSILANIARKVDRLGGSETSDETSADTAMDLMIYLAKYRTWLTDVGMGAGPSNPMRMYSEDPHWANELLLKIDNTMGTSGLSRETRELWLKEQFEKLFHMASQDKERYRIVDGMLVEAYRLARQLWEAEQAPLCIRMCTPGDASMDCPVHSPKGNGLDVGSTCPKCGKSQMTTSGGRTPLKCIGAACNYTPSKAAESVDEYRGADHD